MNPIHLLKPPSTLPHAEDLLNGDTTTAQRMGSDDPGNPTEFAEMIGAMSIQTGSLQTTRASLDTNKPWLVAEGRSMGASQLPSETTQRVDIPAIPPDGATAEFDRGPRSPAAIALTTVQTADAPPQIKRHMPDLPATEQRFPGDPVQTEQRANATGVLSPLHSGTSAKLLPSLAHAANGVGPADLLSRTGALGASQSARHSDAKPVERLPPNAHPHAFTGITEPDAKIATPQSALARQSGGAAVGWTAPPAPLHPGTGRLISNPNETRTSLGPAAGGGISAQTAPGDVSGKAPTASEEPQQPMGRAPHAFQGNDGNTADRPGAGAQQAASGSAGLSAPDHALADPFPVRKPLESTRNLGANNTPMQQNAPDRVSGTSLPGANDAPITFTLEASPPASAVRRGDLQDAPKSILTMPAGGASEDMVQGRKLEAPQLSGREAPTGSAASSPAEKEAIANSLATVAALPKRPYGTDPATATDQTADLPPMTAVRITAASQAASTAMPKPGTEIPAPYMQEAAGQAQEQFRRGLGSDNSQAHLAERGRHLAEPDSDPARTPSTRYAEPHGAEKSNVAAAPPTGPQAIQSQNPSAIAGHARRVRMETTDRTVEAIGPAPDRRGSNALRSPADSMATPAVRSPTEPATQAMVAVNGPRAGFPPAGAWLQGDAETMAVAAADGSLSETRPPGTRPEASSAPEARARQVVPQIVQVIQGAGNGEIDLQLNPEELGRVRMALMFQDGTAQVMIQSDRAETAELLRRHGDLLRSELEAIGYSHVDISFANGSSADGSGERRSGDGSAAGAPETSGTAAPVSTNDVKFAGDGRLNLRL